MTACCGLPVNRELWLTRVQAAYYDTMIAFGVVFLVKVLSKDTQAVRIDRPGTFDLLDRLAGTLQLVTRPMSKHHLLASISSSIRSVVDNGRLSDTHTPRIAAQRQSTSAPTDQAFDFNPLPEPGQPGFIANFDFFSPGLGDLDTTFMDYSNS